VTAVTRDFLMSLDSLASQARTIRQCLCALSLSGLLATLPGVSRVRLPPAPPHRCDDATAKVSHLHSDSQRLVALYTAGKP
jgi:hypothetical protein